jgi:hypothetical protein
LCCGDLNWWRAAAIDMVVDYGDEEMDEWVLELVIMVMVLL